ncbi:MAG: serine/threonine-protein phosphatase, partial [Spirochaetaceae bacterium]|nr:serine/threonine-protein phosphatase [Spirochaetaceae bacterium]
MTLQESQKLGMFIETASYQVKKKGQSAPGDVFLSQKSMSGARIVSVLSDGLGSGVKANVLASLTATMLAKFILMDIPPGRATEIIINSLPVCSERGLAYATFTLVDARHTMSVRIIEYENPPLIILRNGEPLMLEKERIPITRKKKNTGPQNETLFLSKLSALPGDRIIFFSDGVTQAGMGGETHPRGWGFKNAQNRVITAVRANPSISASALAQTLTQSAEYADQDGPNDDISCAVVYFRKPRDLLVLTGPPFRPESDREFARIFTEFPGRKIISGGTTAQIIARELGGTITADTGAYSGDQPPGAKMEGADLVCEGILTLGTVAEELSADDSARPYQRSPSARIRELLLDSDRIAFLVGTKINEAHQDPSMPAELEIRRNVVKRIASLLEEKYMKAVYIQY